MSNIETFIRTALGEFGPVLDDPTVVELSANQNGAVFVERHGVAPEHLGSLDATARERIIRFCATEAGVPVTDEAPIVSAKMPGTGFRFEGVKPPASEGPLFSIRFHGARIYTMSEYLDAGIVNQGQADRLITAMRSRKNIIVAGGPGSGKTTFLNMLIGEMFRFEGEADRLVIIEDTPELKTDNLNAVFLKASTKTDMTRLLASTLRLRPDRIIVGEVRDGAALAMIKAWNTGNPGGLASLHADSAHATLSRIDMLIREVTAMPIPEIIGLGVDMVVFIEATREGRRVKEIIEVKGYENEKFITE